MTISCWIINLLSYQNYLDKKSNGKPAVAQFGKLIDNDIIARWYINSESASVKLITRLYVLSRTQKRKESIKKAHIKGEKKKKKEEYSSIFFFKSDWNAILVNAP